MVVLQRSYSRQVGETSCETEMGRSGNASRSACPMAIS